MSPHLWWYVARGAGLVSWVLLTLAVVWGLLLSGRFARRRPRPAWVLDLHRFLGGLALVFVGVHLVGLVADSYVGFGPTDILVPMASAWKPGPVAWGVVGLYLLLAIEITSLLMRRIPRRVWHAVHLTSFGLFVVSTVHLLTAGTDTGNPVLQWIVLLATLLVADLLVVRVFSRATRPARTRAPAAAVPRPGSLHP